MYDDYVWSRDTSRIKRFWPQLKTYWAAQIKVSGASRVVLETHSKKIKSRRGLTRPSSLTTLAAPFAPPLIPLQSITADGMFTGSCLNDIRVTPGCPKGTRAICAALAAAGRPDNRS